MTSSKNTKTDISYFQYDSSLKKYWNRLRQMANLNNIRLRRATMKMTKSLIFIVPKYRSVSFFDPFWNRKKTYHKNLLPKQRPLFVVLEKITIFFSLVKVVAHIMIKSDIYWVLKITRLQDKITNNWHKTVCQSSLGKSVPVLWKRLKSDQEIRAKKLVYLIELKWKTPK